MKSGVVPGRAGFARTVTTLPRSMHSLTAVFTPTNPAAYAQSTSAPVPLRVSQLTALVATANRHVDETCYQVAGQGLGAVLTELHVRAVSGDPDVRRAALAALAEACIVAAGIARPLETVSCPPWPLSAPPRPQRPARRWPCCSWTTRKGTATRKNDNLVVELVRRMRAVQALTADPSE